MELSLVVPVYKEEKNLAEFRRRLLPILEGCTSSYEIIFCLDPSPDRTREMILQYRAENPAIKLLVFSRRFGQQMATLAGMQYASGDAVIVMDVDLQDPPELITEMVAKRKEGYDVVLAQRRTRTGEPWTKRLIVALGYRVIHRWAEVEITPNTGDFRLMSRRVVEEVIRLKECHGFLRGMVAVVGFPTAILQFDRVARHAGQTNYGHFFGSLRGGFNGIFCFSVYPLTFCLQLGLALLSLGVGLGILEIAQLWTHAFLPFPHAGFVALALFLGGIQLIATGILGEYIGRIYEEVKQRPKFIVQDAIGFAQGPVRPIS